MVASSPAAKTGFKLACGPAPCRMGACQECGRRAVAGIRLSRAQLGPGDAIARLRGRLRPGAPITGRLGRRHRCDPAPRIPTDPSKLSTVARLPVGPGPGPRGQQVGFRLPSPAAGGQAASRLERPAPGSDVDVRRPTAINASRSAASYRTARDSRTNRGPFPLQRHFWRVRTLVPSRRAASASRKSAGFTVMSSNSDPLREGGYRFAPQRMWERYFEEKSSPFSRSRIRRRRSSRAS